MSDELTSKQVIEGIERNLVGWEEGEGYCGGYDFDAERALVNDLRTLLEITKTALEPNMTVRCQSSITHPGATMRLKTDHVYIHVFDDQFAVTCDPCGTQSVTVEVTGQVMFGLRALPDDGDIVEGAR
jgi:hypothetical protein